MIPLAPKFRARGFVWLVLQREGDVAIVEQWKEGWGDPICNDPVLNVIIVQKHKARRLPTGEMTMDSEGIPSWEQWGTQAWTCADKADAKRRFNLLVDAAAAEAIERADSAIVEAALAANAPPSEYVSRFTGSEGEKAQEHTPTAFIGPRIHKGFSPPETD